MPIEITTVYDKKKLLRYSDYHCSRRMILWVFLGICTFSMLAIIVLNAIFSYVPPEQYAYLAVLLLYDAIVVFLLFGLPRLTINKNKALNSVAKYKFSDGSFEVDTNSPTMTSNTTVKYDRLTKVRADRESIYLYIVVNQAYIVDISSLTIQQLTELKELLENNIEAKKIKW